MAVANPREVPEYELNPMDIQIRKSDGISKASFHSCYSVEIIFFLETFADVVILLVCTFFLSLAADLIASLFCIQKEERRLHFNSLIFG